MNLTDLQLYCHRVAGGRPALAFRDANVDHPSCIAAAISAGRGLIDLCVAPRMPFMNRIVVKQQSRYRQTRGRLSATISARRLSAMRAADAFTESRAKCA